MSAGYTLQFCDIQVHLHVNVKSECCNSGIQNARETAKYYAKTVLGNS